MRANRNAKALTLACGAMVLAAGCNDDATSPVRAAVVHPAGLSMANEAPSPAAGAQLLAVNPFTVRAPLNPFFINQAPDFMIRSRVRADLVIQRLVTAPGIGAWHTHPGPSFGIVEQGQVMITRVTEDGCTRAVYRAGEAYFEVAGQVHRADVLSREGAVEHKVRFNTPVGGPFSSPAADPGC